MPYGNNSHDIFLHTWNWAWIVCWARSRLYCCAWMLLVGMYVHVREQRRLCWTDRVSGIPAKQWKILETTTSNLTKMGACIVRVVGCHCIQKAVRESILIYLLSLSLNFEALNLWLITFLTIPMLFIITRRNNSRPFVVRVWCVPCQEK